MEIGGGMETCNITEAMEILGCSRKHIQKLLRERRLYGRIVGRAYRFVREDLINFIRTGDTVAAGSRCSESSMEEKTLWHYTKEATPGGVRSQRKVESELDALLGLQTKSPRRSSLIN